MSDESRLSNEFCSKNSKKYKTVYKIFLIQDVKTAKNKGTFLTHLEKTKLFYMKMSF